MILADFLSHPWGVIFPRKKNYFSPPYSFLFPSMQFNIQRLAFDAPYKIETLEEAKGALHKLIRTNNK
jgi:hypothetical protein